jgi:TonB-dependent receptor
VGDEPSCALRANEWLAIPGAMRTTRSLFRGSLFIFAAVLGTAVSVFAQDTGQIAGRVVNTFTGEPVNGALVFEPASGIETRTDLSGNYVLSGVPVGSVRVAVARDGFTPTNIENVRVVAGRTATINVPLNPVGFGDVVEMAELVIAAEVVENSDIGLLAQRQRAAAVSDAIGADQISRLGFGDAAAAMRAVTGASVVGDKYVYVRGLGERYGNTALNGSEVPSADPDRRAVQLDLFPASLIDSIVTTKTFTPDKPGNFAGGSVDIRTKTIPEQQSLSLSFSLGFNTQSTGEEALTYDGPKDFLGRDRGSRQIPAELRDRTLPAPGQASDSEIGALSKAFSGTMAPRTRKAPYDWSFSGSYGNRFVFPSGVLGVVASITYDVDHSGYRGGLFARHDLQSSNAPSLQTLISLDDQRSTESITAGALLRLGWQFQSGHEIAFTALANFGSEDIARRQVGLNLAGGGLDGDQVFTTRSLRLIEREVSSFQLNGRHLFPAARDLLVEWSLSRSSNTQDEPDVRFFSSAARTLSGGQVDFVWQTSGLASPSRRYRELTEEKDELQLDFTLPVVSGGERGVKLKAGGLYSTSDREFRERGFAYINIGRIFDGNDQTFFDPARVGNVGADGFFVTDTIFVREISSPRNNYDGTFDLLALYAMVDAQLTRRLRFIGGGRYEKAEMELVSFDPRTAPGTLNDRDWLPALSLVYQLSENMNLRAAFGRTLARPNFREKAPYETYEFEGGEVEIGNPNLARTLINNFDLRWEWFTGRGQLVASSLFYKKLKNPIEQAYFAPTGVIINQGERTWRNQEEATLVGLELEVRQDLGRFASWLQRFSIGMNFTFSESETEVPEAELQIARLLNSEAPETRPLFGQSEILFNLDLSYQDFGRGTAASIYLNHFGERLALVAPPGTPDIYEQPVTTLDFVLRQRVGARWRLGFKATNLLDPAIETTQTYREVEYVRSLYRRGRKFSVSLGYDF